MGGMSRRELSKTMTGHIAPALLERGFFEINSLDPNEDVLGQGRSFFYRASQTCVVRANIWVTDLEEPCLVADLTTHRIAPAADSIAAAIHANDEIAQLNMQVDRVIDIPLSSETASIPEGVFLFAWFFSALFFLWAFIEPIIAGAQNKSNARPSALARRFQNELPAIEHYIRTAR